jgi:site-specific DNA recombinase
VNVALYVRVSTTRQAEINLSIPDQLKQMRARCAQNGDVVVAEYVEPGATGTDDGRPVFREMIQDTEMVPPPFDAILVHSLSRFYREEVEFALYERSLKKRGVRIISITQETADDPVGNFSRRMINLFDDFSSKENSKHTRRGMKENAIQGFFNGSRAPFGYQAVIVPGVGNRGRAKKKLAVDEAEAIIVRKIFDVYEHGVAGKTMGLKQLATKLNADNILMRGGH